MDALKDTGNLLAFGNAAGLLAVFAYFHNQNKILREEFARLTEHVNKNNKVVSEASRDNKAKETAIFNINQKLREMEEELDSVLGSVQSQSIHDCYIEKDAEECKKLKYKDDKKKYRSERLERSERPERLERSERSERLERSERSERSEHDKLERNNRRLERSERNGYHSKEEKRRKTKKPQISIYDEPTNVEDILSEI